MPSSPNRFVISVDSVYPDPVGRLRVRLVFLCFPKPSTFDSRPSLFPKSFSCNTYGSPRKCCKQKTYSMVKLLRCNAYKKQAGWGMLLSFLVAPPYRYVAPTYLLCLPLLRKLPGVYPEFPFWKGGVLPTFKCAFCIPNGVAGRSTFKPSNDPPVPLQRKALGATIGKGARNSSRSGETTPLPPVSKDSERTSGTARSWSPSQVVPGSSVLTLDRSAGWLAFQQRVGKAGSVRLG